MYIKSVLVLSIAAAAIAAPDGVAKKQAKRQANLSELSVLASIAGVTALPTDPAARSSLEAVATGLAAILPNPSVFSVLETAVPHSLISQLAQNPAAASSFQSQFAAGSTPGWFSSLPTDVRSYLHTYQPSFAAVASGANNTGNHINSTQSSTHTSTSRGASSSDSTAAGSGSTTNSQSASSASAAAGSTSTSKGGAPKQTGAVAAGIVGVVGLLGLAAAL
ncbi:MAG: hypothetical protein M1830_004353 [Pleopsidium flavum]|nr:MAG: hypothetical protein M1830_004353 [Pleopsidium flavum]